jgi:hypothetical protein
VGLLYKLGDEAAQIVHVAWQYRLMHEVPTDEYCWVQSGLDEMSRCIIAPAIAEVASEEQRSIPYSPIYDGIYFEAGDLKYKREAPGDGLTCATLIMAIFDALGFALFNRQEWPARAEDADWHNWIVNQLEQSGRATQEHIKVIREKPRGARFRPEEVAGAMTEANILCRLRERKRLAMKFWQK